MDGADGKAAHVFVGNNAGGTPGRRPPRVPAHHPRRVQQPPQERGELVGRAHLRLADRALPPGPPLRRHPTVSETIIRYAAINTITSAIARGGPATGNNDAPSCLPVDL